MKCIVSPRGIKLYFYRNTDKCTIHNAQCTNYELAHSKWLEAVKGLENEPERGRRCEKCFYHRLKATAEKAAELGIPYFATTLASSRWKNIDQVNEAGRKAALLNPPMKEGRTTPEFWAQNWRKDGLQERRNELLKQYHFYNQLYCGCEYSAPSNSPKEGEEKRPHIKHE
ncbi:MAG TPA: diacylglucosamine hydrolase [Ruminococcaceae bacterium]|nr:diacylglucosamine hydrolase [Oscillospiraceae bacterium]